MAKSARRWIPWGNLGVCLLLTAGTIGFVVDALRTPDFHATNAFLYSLAVAPVPLLAYPIVGTLIMVSQPRNRIGLLFGAIAVLWATSLFTGAYATDAMGAHGGGWFGEQAANWYTSWEFFPCLGLTLVYVPLLFPNGRTMGGRWRWVLWTGGIGITLVSVVFALAPGKLDDYLGGLPNPYGILPDALTLVFTAIGIPLTLGSTVAAAAALVIRLRRSRGAEREQMEWIAFAAAALAVMFAVHLLAQSTSLADAAPWYELFWVLAVCGVPIASGLAILKRGLFDIELIISRTLVYVVLTAIVVASYVALVTAAGAVIRDNDWLPALFATGVLIVLFQPLRDRVQRGVDRLLFGDRRDPYAVIAQLGRRLEATPAPDEILPTVLRTLTEALKLPYAAILLHRDGVLSLAAAAGAPAVTGLRVPLIYQTESIGELVVASRTPGEAFGPTDRRLLEDLARQVGVAAHGVRLMADLQRSRERIVSAREEERRRLRRDLHDGLGSQLAALALHAGALRPLVRSDPDGVEAELGDVRDELRTAVGDIRRIAHGLRPPALDELGLAGALRERALRFARGAAETGEGGVPIDLQLSDELPPLPAAVEVAIYRITEEALTNVVKHARARRCSIRLATGDGVELTIDDDGTGLPLGGRTGVGLLSMRERAEELGGAMTIGPRTDGPGTRLHVTLPRIRLDGGA